MLKRHAIIVAAPLLSALVYWLMSTAGVEQPAVRMAFIVTWVAFWWLTEAVNLGVTALLPFIFMPLLGIAKADDVAMQYMDQIIFLFIGGFFIAYAMEKWGLHQRVAYRIILLMGNKPSKVLLGIMLTAYFISMWVSNTATVMMLLASVLAITRQKEIYHEEARKGSATALLLGLSFSATIGGLASPVGTPPNMIFLGFLSRELPHLPPIDFLQWMSFGVPFSFSLLVVCFFILRFIFIPRKVDFEFDMSFIKTKQQQLGKMNMEEKTVLAVFLSTVFLWLFRDNLNFGFVQLKGWNNLFGSYGKFIKDSTVVVFTSFFLFVIPSSKNNAERILEWKDVKKLPFNIILLFGGGFALANGFETSGLSNVLAMQLNALNGLPVFVILLGLAVLVTTLSEFASNTASIQLMLPVIMPLATGLSIHPMLLMLTATFAASLGYMLPVATAANTIVYGSNEVNVKDMMRAGLLLDIAGIVLLLLFMNTLGIAVFGVK
ncbi:MAG: SLC13/DASS family transporter [Chitinophagales bacterium]|nr:SLC13/DASS family transporter [Chitinophagales bacterium]